MKITLTKPSHIGGALFDTGSAVEVDDALGELYIERGIATHGHVEPEAATADEARVDAPDEAEVATADPPAETAASTRTGRGRRRKPRG